MATSETRRPTGVQIAERDGQRSTSRLGKDVLARAVEDADSSLAGTIRRERNWRKRYTTHFAGAVTAGAKSAKNALGIAEHGLRALHDNLTFVHDEGEGSLSESLSHRGHTSPATSVVEGRGTRVEELIVPYRGEQLSGDGLLRQLETWEKAGVIEPSASQALRLVVRNRKWLDLRDKTFALLGAASEMGPLSPLSSWGADVIAVDLPRRQLWEHIVDTSVKGAGRLRAPVPAPNEDPQDVVANAGADLLDQLPEVFTWLRSFDRPMVVGNYVYADGVNFLRLAGAVDALVERLVDAGTVEAVAYLATPTDVYAVPHEIVERAGRRRLRPMRSVMGTLTGRRVYAPNYRELIEGENGRRWGLSDALVPIQGPNYALAKHVQRWRALELRERGCVSSANVAPATRTRSVVKNRMLAAAYRGAPRFGIEIFEPETSRALTAALLVHDLNNPTAAARPGTALDHPYDLLMDAALHGGMWTSAYEPRSVLPIALARGMLGRSPNA